jgi:peptide/histidine transporter 3/4
MALGLLSVAVGSYLSGAVVAAVGAGTAAAGWNDGAGWLPPSLNAGRLDLFFWLMAALAAANTVLFVWVASTYQYKDVPHGAASRAVGPPRPPATPPTPSSRPPPAAPVAVGAGRRTARWGRGGVPSPDAYGRSVTYVPPSPALPAPFR